MNDENKSLQCCCGWKENIDFKNRQLTEEEKESFRKCFLDENNSPYWTILLLLFIFSGSKSFNVNDFFDKIELPEDKRPEIPFLDENGNFRSMTEDE